ncbi:sirohydrochlorin chelatase [Leifsonia shinshuensis]|uniref:Cobalamin biosynthesis protein CbiX n=1 Tax=Leifsonia shinshuensis TaxID=150026 RepID=A0A7G6Y9Q5_9MICO|nr:CbiX/SirB N-terminal domain-containing protein [Leifsonia shinshuensis]QNE35220.1 cobalamin biosynthesis protein CbiX [Leifsonia shinshuensis]
MIAILTVSHGTSDSLGQRAVSRFAEAVHDAVDAEVAAHAFVDVQQPDVPSALAALPAEATVVIVPLLLSRGYHLGHDLRKAAAPFGERAIVAGALGPDPRLAQILRRRLQEAGLGRDDRIVLAAAGSSDRAGVDDGLEAGLLLGVACLRPVTVGFLSAAQPSLDSAVARAAADGPGRVVAASYLLAPGYFHRLAQRSAADIVTEPLLHPDRMTDWELVAIARNRYFSALSDAGVPLSDVATPRRRASSTIDATKP